MKTINTKLIGVIAVAGAMSLASCSDDDMSKRVADYDPQYKGELSAETADYSFDADTHTQTVSFTADMAWTVKVVDADGKDCTWAKVSPESGELPNSVEQIEGVAKSPVDFTVTVTIDANENINDDRGFTLSINTAKGSSKNITFAQEHKILWLEPDEIEDYEKYTAPGSWNPHFENGADYMRRHDSYYSWHRSKQSEHFVVFWSPEFGADPNADDVAPAMRVDIDDLLVKAEKFFDTNVNKLKMATLGQEKSQLDNYKMQIYLIYQDEWLATGSGYDDKIGALWVNPSTCQPVGSTIAHEIGHSFQYQTYADKVQKQGAENDYRHGFRYGFGPDGQGGCAFWEQCAQWQAQRDYPEEQFGYHVPVWQANYHRHFTHEWMRYASYWLQTYWVNKHGIEAYGRIWQESAAPEDPLETYTRLFCNGDINTMYADYYDYAAHMVCYDIDGIREYAYPEVKGDYHTALYKVSDCKYQVGYASAPGTTGFNVIELKMPAPGTTVSVKVDALEAGSPLHKNDSGVMVDGDGKKVGNTDAYNNNEHYLGKTNADYRYGYVAVVDGRAVYSDMKSGAHGTASYTVPQNASELYFVICATPEDYHRHWWNDLESDDEQWPYTVEISNTDVVEYVQTVDVVLDPDAVPANVTIDIDVNATLDNANYDYAHFNLAYYDGAAICYAFCLMPEDLQEAMVRGDEYFDEDGGQLQDPEGKVYMRLKQTDGSTTVVDNCGGEYGGFWADGEGNLKGWGEGTYTKLHTIYDMEVGFMPGWGEAGKSYPEVVELVYTKDGTEYIATINFHFNLQ